MKQKITKVIIFIVAVIAILVAAPFVKGKPYPVKIGETEIIPGKTTMKELFDNGFYLTQSSTGSLTDAQIPNDTEITAKSYVDRLKLQKAEEWYASIEIINTTSSKKSLADCVVGSVWLVGSQTEKSYIDGVLFEDITVESAKEKYGKTERESDTEIAFKKGKYNLIFAIENGTIKYITSNKNRND